MRALVILAVSISAVFSCGDDIQAPCTVNWLKAELTDPICKSALSFAMRDSAKIVPSQEEVDRYYDRCLRLAAAEPAASHGGTVPRRRTSGLGFDLGVAEISTRNPKVIAALARPTYGTFVDVPPTGDLLFDLTMAEIDEPQISGLTARTDGIYGGTLISQSVFNEERLHASLLRSDSFLPDPVDPAMRGLGDAMWHWIDASGSGTDDATADLDIRLGWGDCFNGCIFFHFLHAIIPADGDATVYDLGGDPLPVPLSPNTRPPP